MRALYVYVSNYNQPIKSRVILTLLKKSQF